MVRTEIGSLRRNLRAVMDDDTGDMNVKTLTMATHVHFILADHVFGLPGSSASQVTRFSYAGSRGVEVFSSGSLSSTSCRLSTSSWTTETLPMAFELSVGLGPLGRPILTSSTIDVNEFDDLSLCAAELVISLGTIDPCALSVSAVCPGEFCDWRPVCEGSRESLSVVCGVPAIMLLKSTCDASSDCGLWGLDMMRSCFPKLHQLRLWDPQPRLGRGISVQV